MWSIDKPGNYKFPETVVSIMGLKRLIPSFNLTVKPLDKQV